jgi:Mg2+/citrate symporter
MERKRIFNILFWIALIIGIVLILWMVFGDSPTELGVVITFMLALLFKIWSVSDETKEFKHEVKMSFVKVREDFSELKKKLKVKK